MPDKQPNFIVPHVYQKKTGWEQGSQPTEVLTFNNR